MPNAKLAERLDAALPQTQCTQCAFPHCRAYAEAIADGRADIDRCAPGGATTVRLLAEILGVAAKPLDPRYGAPAPRRRAVIDETRCIGCRKCLDACPVDAIVGTNKWMHTVIAAQCTGCALCLPPCPVDCIDMVATAPPADAGPWPEYAARETARWRELAEARRARRARGVRTGAPRSAPRRGAALRDAPSAEQIRAEIAAAVERVKRRRAGA